MAIANRMVTTRQIGYLLGFLGQRVLGQYDLALLSAESTPGRLLFVEENIRRDGRRAGRAAQPVPDLDRAPRDHACVRVRGPPVAPAVPGGRLERQLALASRAAPRRMSRDAARHARSALRGAGAGEPGWKV